MQKLTTQKFHNIKNLEFDICHSNNKYLKIETYSVLIFNNELT